MNSQFPPRQPNKTVVRIGYGIGGVSLIALLVLAIEIVVRLAILLWP